MLLADISLAVVGGRDIIVNAGQQPMLSTAANVLDSCWLRQKARHYRNVPVCISSFRSQAAVNHLPSQTIEIAACQACDTQKTLIYAVILLSEVPAFINLLPLAMRSSALLSLEGSSNCYRFT